MTTDEQERRIDLAIAAIRVLDVMNEEELAEARERMRRFEDDAAYHDRVADQRIAGSSGS